MKPQQPLKLPADAREPLLGEMKGGPGSGSMMKDGAGGGGGGVMKAAMGPAPMTDVPYRKLFHWGWVVVSAALGPFLTTTFLSIFNQTLLQFNVKVFAALVGSLKSDGGLAPTAKSGSVFAPLIPSGVTTLFMLFTGLTLLWILLAFAEKMLTAWSDNVMLARLQRRLHDQLIRLGPTYHRSHDVGETTMVVSRFATGTQLLLRDLVSAPIVRTFGIGTALFMLYDTIATLGDTPLALKLALFASLLAIPAVGVRFAKRLRAAFGKVRDSDLAVAEELQNSLGQPLEVQLMGAETQRSAAFAEKLAVHARNKISAAVRNELTSQLQTTAPTLIQLGFLAYGVHLATSSAASPDATAGIVAIYYFVPAAIQPLQQLLQFFNGLNSAWPQVEKVVEILEVAPEVEDRVNARDLPAGTHDVKLDDVTFSYGLGLPPVLDALTHEFTVGRCWAIVGASGSGKSTVFSLISRLCDPQSGTVRVGGADVREVGLASLRGHVVRVAQFPLFIHDTVRANFKLAKSDATDAEIQAICERTGLWEILCRASADRPLDYLLPRDVSQGLSGGQRRLLAVTRALILHPSVLLLDEPSTGLDNITLQHVIRVIREFKTTTAIIVVDHDIEGFVGRVADGICVLEKGKIVATGTHQELAGQDGLYRRLIEASKEGGGEAVDDPAGDHLGAPELKVS
jgi:ATP-binding cassette subfamily B protein